MYVWVSAEAGLIGEENGNGENECSRVWNTIVRTRTIFFCIVTSKCTNYSDADAGTGAGAGVREPDPAAVGGRSVPHLPQLSPDHKSHRHFPKPSQQHRRRNHHLRPQRLRLLVIEEARLSRQSHPGPNQVSLALPRLAPLLHPLRFQESQPAKSHHYLCWWIVCSQLYR